MLVQASSIRVAESFRVLFKMFVVFSPMKCPLQRRHRQRYNQLERRCENRLIRTILSRAIEAIKINSIRWSMWDITQRPQDQSAIHAAGQ